MNNEMNCDIAAQDNIITLTDQFGEDTDFLFLDLLDQDGKTYLILAPMEAENDEITEVVILQIDDFEDEEATYCSVEDEKELCKVFDCFKQKRKNDYEFVNDYGEDF